MTIRIIPVIDLMNGMVVRGVGGRRIEYRPMSSPLCPTADPLDLARSFRERRRFSELYVADLDAIGGKEPAIDLFARMQSCGLRLWVDAGVRTAESAARLADAETHRIIVGLETLRGPAELQAALRRWPERMVFSLDLKDGIPLGETSAWGSSEPEEIGGRAVRLGIRSVIVLDLSRVGAGQGPGTEELLRRFAAKYPDVEWIAGGGVRGSADLLRLNGLGVSAALVSSALHDGSL
jgi:phosphoribosylformimino-5-aminoimidazole carboxamide ribotide isomerase